MARDTPGSGEQPQPTSPARRRGRPREASVDERLGAATLALLRDGGPAAVTVEAVAAQAGVAKTSIYRRHANRGELLTVVLREAIGTPEVLSTGTVRDKIRFSLRQAWRQMEEVLGPGGLAAIVGDSDPEFTGLFREALRPYDDVLMARIREDVAAGALRADVDPDTVVSLLLGAYLGELVRHGRVGSDWLDRSLEMIWAALRP